MPSKIFKQILGHKLITGIILILIIGGGYFGYQKLAGNKNTVRYATATVEKGTLIVSVSGSGQVSVSDQVDIKPKVSGDIVYVGVKNGWEVKDGALLAQIDTRDTGKAVRDAETALETAKLELEELLSPPDDLTLLQAENSLIQAKESKQKAEDNLKKAYEDGFNTVANTFLELPGIMAGLQDTLFSYNFNATQQNIDYYADAVKIYDEKVLEYKTDAYNKYQTARKAYESNFQDYKSASRFSDTSVIESLINETYETVKNVAEATKSTNNLIQFYQDKLIERDFKPQTLSTTHLSSLNTYTGKTNSQLLNLLSTQNSIRDNKDAIVDADRSIEEKELSLAKLKAGADELEIRAKKIAIQQKEDTLLTAKQNLADCYIYAPFNGVVAETNIKKGDSVSAGTVLTSIITQQKIAEISLNEVDVAKVKVDQKATLTFDALPEVSISGKVMEIDTVGTVAQGVVSYKVKISFDTEEEKVKPGMSVTADIITDAKQDVLVLPNGAIKSQGNSYYVELVEASEEMKQQLLANTSGVTLPNPPKSQSIEVGLSNDLSTEIVSGLKEGDIVVTSTISPNKVQTTKTQTNQSRGTQEFRIPGL